MTDILRKIIRRETVYNKFNQLTKIKSFEAGRTKKNIREVPKSWIKIHFKSYPRFEKKYLPRRLSLPRKSLEKLLIERRSSREFCSKQLSIEEISKILFFSSGIVEISADWKEGRRFYPSAGARYPLEIYPIILGVRGLKMGIYHYDVKRHALEKILAGNFLKNVLNFINQEWMRNASVIILISGVFERTRVKYGDRGYRYVLMEAGHVMQNIYLLCTAMRLGCCAIGGFIDDGFNELLDLDGEKESVIYIAAIGRLS